MKHTNGGKNEKSRVRTMSNGQTIIDDGYDDDDLDLNDIILDTLPIIYTNDRQLPDISQEVLNALSAANQDNPRLFVQSGSLVILRIDENDRASISPLELDALRGEIARAAKFYYEPVKRGEPRSVNPPIEVCRDILSLGKWPFPPIKGLVSTPIIRPDGSVLETPGYDPATQMYYWPVKGFKIAPVPQNPTDEDIRAAKEAIWDILCDFPYVSDADKANAYAAMLTPYVRMLVGTVPMAIFEAPKQGTGKGLHVKILSLIQTGKRAEMTPLPAEEVEREKALASLLKDGTTLIIFDNLVGTLNSTVLASVLTLEVWRPRLMGKLSTLSLHNTATWVATANNVRLGSDFPRRCYSVRLDAKVMSPEKRDGFRHEDLEEYVREVRPQIVHALLVLIRSWYAAGCPMPEKRVIVGSFDQWARIMAGVLHHAGIPGFLGNAATLHEKADEEGPIWDGFFSKWEELFSDQDVSAAEVAKRFDALKEFMTEPLLKAYDRNPNTFSRVLGNALASQEDVRYSEDGLRVVRGRIDHKVQLWRVVRDWGVSIVNPPQTPRSKAA